MVFTWRHISHVGAQNNREKVFWDFDCIIMQNMSHNLLLFCAPTWPSHHVIENHLWERQATNTPPLCEYGIGLIRFIILARCSSRGASMTRTQLRSQPFPSRFIYRTLPLGDSARKPISLGRLSMQANLPWEIQHGANLPWETQHASQSPLGDSARKPISLGRLSTQANFPWEIQHASQSPLGDSARKPISLGRFSTQANIPWEIQHASQSPLGDSARKPISLGRFSKQANFPWEIQHASQSPLGDSARKPISLGKFSTQANLS